MLNPPKSPYKLRGESKKQWILCFFYTGSSLVWEQFPYEHQETVAVSMCISETVIQLWYKPVQLIKFNQPNFYSPKSALLLERSIISGTLKDNGGEDKDAALVFIPLWHLQISFSSCSTFLVSMHRDLKEGAF